MANKKIIIEDTAGNQFECEVPAATKLSVLAGDFFHDRGWPERDAQGRGQRATVELVDASNNNRTRRLNGDQTLSEADIPDNSVLRIFPESIAGLNEKQRLGMLISDHRQMKQLCEQEEKISFTANLNHAPNEYEVTFEYDSFVDIPKPKEKPRVDNKHIAKIHLHALYPREAPVVRWETQIFHPNIHFSRKLVCLGQLGERYLPSLGLARIVNMLAEMIQWHNFDLRDPFNKDAAEWAANPANWKYIQEIGGYSPLQMIPRQELINPDNWGNPSVNRTSIFNGHKQPNELKAAWEREKKRTKISFKHLNKI